ncbi:MAG: HemK/PrmC family methyltransferase [Gemmatimonas sp.]
MIVRALLVEVEGVLRASRALEDSGEHTNLDREAREILSVLLNVSPGEVSRRGVELADAALVDHAIGVANRRALGEPLAYSLGTAAFRHLVLHVDRRVLIPRPETEIVVDVALRAVQHRSGGIAVDIGTGSGAIALSLATEGRFDRVLATDISVDALAVAETNYGRVAQRHAPVEFRLGADLVPIAGIKACLIVSNPPYIAPEEALSLPASVRDWEPALALFADDGGMARYDQLLSGAADHLEPGGWLVLEVDARRATETARRATNTGRYTGVRITRDLAGRERVLEAQARTDFP